MGFPVRGVHFYYGQSSYPGERKAIKAIARFFQIRIENAQIHPVTRSEKDSELPGRNARFVFAALNFFDQDTGIVALGIHSNTRYYDCTPIFVHDLQMLLNGYYAGAVQLDAPFLSFTKRDVFAYCREYQVPIDVTFSCERGVSEPCGVCSSCIDRRYYDASA
jgi:7-cyano-7-deazaguanine synthase